MRPAPIFRAKEQVLWFSQPPSFSIARSERWVPGSASRPGVSAPCQGMKQDRGACSDVERLDEASARDVDDRVARLERRLRQSMLFVAKHQRQRPFRSLQLLDRQAV